MKRAQGTGGDGDHAEPMSRDPIFIIIIVIVVIINICWPPFLMMEEAELEDPGLFFKMFLVMCLEE